jgi:hypothetical protein
MDRRSGARQSSRSVLKDSSATQQRQGSYQEYLVWASERDARTALWNEMPINEQMRAASAEGLSVEDKGATLGGDLTAAAEVAVRKSDDDPAPLWWRRLKEYQFYGDPIHALFAIAFWPADRPLAPELRWFLQQGLMPLLVAAEEDNPQQADDVYAALQHSLGLSGAPGRASAAIAQYQHGIRVRKVWATYQQKKAAVLARKGKLKEAENETCDLYGIKRSTLHNYLAEAQQLKKLDEEFQKTT